MTAWEGKIGAASLRTEGKIPNIIKAVEELAELQRALCRYMMRPSDAKILRNVHEELADAAIMLNRMMLIFKPLEVACWKDFKLNRQAERLGLLDRLTRDWCDIDAQGTLDPCAAANSPSAERPINPTEEASYR